MKMAAIYARVSSEQQREEHTIASQTVALIEFAQSHELEVPREWVFEDEGYSGASLERPGLERIRDLAAEGQIQAVLVHAPDRLSRKYAYQVLLIEEFARQGVATLFVKAPQSTSPEDQLLIQFQGMIAEYERAQILERSRRGKRHRARSGEVSVLSGAPYGYRYIRRTDEVPASYALIDAEARVVQRVYALYTIDGLSIGEIARRLNAEGIPTRKQSARWERSVVWAMLRNPAYRGVACYGKTRITGRIRVTRALRRRGGLVSSDSAGHERAREDWIEIPVPALVSEDSFARAQELLHENKIRSRRRTITPSVVQGLVSCQKCGYAFSRTSANTSARKLGYYKCIGSDGWRKLGGPVCDNRPVRQDLLDQIVWTEGVRLLEDPTLIQHELDRRLAAARSTDPTQKREQALQRELTRVGNGIERLLNAYQEELLSLEQLRERMPSLRQREQALRTELQAIADQATDRATFLRLAETLASFLGRLHDAANTLDVLERQRIVRLVVKDILIGEDTIVIRHCIPVGLAPTPDSSPRAPSRPHGASRGQSSLLRSGSDDASLRRATPAVLRCRSATHALRRALDHGGVEPAAGNRENGAVGNTPSDTPHQVSVRNGVEVVREVGVDNFAGTTIGDAEVDAPQRHLRVQPWTKAVLPWQQVLFEDRTYHKQHGHLHHSVPNDGDSKWAFATTCFENPSTQQGPRYILLLP
jgi:site-specific DNA recombinase